MSTRVRLAALLLIPAALIGLGVAAVSGAFSSGPYQDPSPIPAPRDPKALNMSTQVSGVTVTLVEVDFSSTSTRAVFDLANPLIQESHVGYLFGPISSEDVQTDGLAGTDLRDQKVGRGTAGIERRELVFPPVIDPTKEVVLQIDTLCLMKDGGPCEERKGPWTFRFVPLAAAIDPVHESLSLNQSAEHGGITVTIHGIELSGSEAIASFRIDAKTEVRPASAGLEMVLPDSSLVRGKEHVGDDGGRTAYFPPLPAEVKAFTLRSQALVLESSEAGMGSPIDMPISLRGRLASSDINGPLQTIAIGDTQPVLDEAIRLDDVVVGSGRLTLDLSNSTAGGGLVLTGLRGDISLVTSDGSEIPAEKFIVSFSKDDSGSVGLGSEHLTFTGVDPSKVVALRTRSVARLVPGPWEFPIQR